MFWINYAYAFYSLEMQAVSLFLLAAYYKILNSFPFVAVGALLLYVGSYQVGAFTFCRNGLWLVQEIYVVLVFAGIVWSNKLANGFWDLPTPNKRTWDQPCSTYKFRLKCTGDICLFTLAGTFTQIVVTSHIYLSHDVSPSKASVFLALPI